MSLTVVLVILGILFLFFILGYREMERERREKASQVYALVPQSASSMQSAHPTPRVLQHEHQQLFPPPTSFTETRSTTFPDSPYQTPDVMVDLSSLLPSEQPPNPLLNAQHFLKGLLGLVILAICLAVAIAILCIAIRGCGIVFDEMPRR